MMEGGTSGKTLQPSYWTEYVVQPGDDLIQIGNRFGVPHESIAALNCLNSKALIFPNQILKIPFPPSPSISTGNSTYDIWDDFITESCTRYNLPDPWPMIVKSQCMQESAFDGYAVSPDTPCGDPTGWGKVSITISGETRTVDEGNSFGAMQITPACGASPNFLLPDGHPNITTDPANPLWSNSVFNPKMNIDAAVNDLTQTLSRITARFQGCSLAQYIEATIGAYNSGDGSIMGCGSCNERAQSYINAVLWHYHTFIQLANYPNPLGL